MRKKIILPTAAAMIAIALTSCATNTPTTRIKKSPEIFQQLSPADQELAQKGQVKEGMERNAVIIALGEPNKMSKGSKNGVAFEKWYYASARPVYSTGVNIGLGYGGFGRRAYSRRRFGYNSLGGFGEYGIHQRVRYVKSISSIVEFDRSGKVTNWSQTQ